ELRSGDAGQGSTRQAAATCPCSAVVATGRVGPGAAAWPRSDIMGGPRVAAAMEPEMPGKKGEGQLQQSLSSAAADQSLPTLTEDWNRSRAASTPVRTVPFSQVLAERRATASTTRVGGRASGGSGSRGGSVQQQSQGQGQQHQQQQQPGMKRRNSFHHWSGSDDPDANASSSQNATSLGNKSDTKLTAKQIMKKYKARIRPRTRLYGVFVMVEICMVIAFFLSARASHRAVMFNYAASAQDGLSGVHEGASHRAIMFNYAASVQDGLSDVHEGYSKKVFQMRNLVQTGQYNWDLQQYLGEGGQTPSNATHAVALLNHVEYAVILGPDFKVLQSASGKRIGETFDPEGIVSAASNQTSASVWTYGILPYAQLMADKPPMLRDRESQLDQAYKGAHPYETKADSLIRWVCMAVKQMDLTTLEPLHPEDPPSGYLLIGVCAVASGVCEKESLCESHSLCDIVNGKSASTSLIGLTLGGMAGVYHKRVNAQPEMDKDGLYWLAASTSDTATLSAERGNGHTLQNVLVQGKSTPQCSTPDITPDPTSAHHTRTRSTGFDPYNAMSNREGHMDYAWGKANTDMAAEVDEIRPYIAGLRKWHPDDEIPPSSGRPAVTLARALMVDTAVTTKFMGKQYVRLALIVVVDLLTLFIATWLFLAPLEAMGRRVRSGQRVDISFLKSLTKRRKFGVVITAVAVFSVLVGVDIRMSCAGNMEVLIRKRNAIEVSVVMEVLIRKRNAIEVRGRCAPPVLRLNLRETQTLHRIISASENTDNHSSNDGGAHQEAQCDQGQGRPCRWFSPYFHVYPSLSELAEAELTTPCVVCCCAAQPGSTMLAYRQGIDQSVRTGRSMQVCTALLTLLDNHNQPSFKDFLIRRLTKVEETIWVEMALLYDGSGELLVAPHAHAMEGLKFDPSGIVNDTLANQLSYTRTALMSAADLAKLNPERLIDRYYNTTPISALHVDETGEDAMVRWASVPLWSKGPYDGPKAGDPLSGVLVIGDVVNVSLHTQHILLHILIITKYVLHTTSLPAHVVLLLHATRMLALLSCTTTAHESLRQIRVCDVAPQGKTRILERANKMVAHGYSAVYFYNSTSQYQMAAGIMRTHGTLFDIDVPLPHTDWLDELRLSTDWHTDDHFTASKTLYFPKYGGKYVVSARCVNKNTVINADGSEVDPYDWRRRPICDCTGYLIQGLPWHTVAPILAPCYAWQYVFVIMCCLKFFAMIYLCYKAYVPFKRIVVSNKFVQAADATPPTSPPPPAGKNAHSSVYSTTFKTAGRDSNPRREPQTSVSIT
ncbi:hypothetical protein JKP88DRAFT_299437, partial [Tribonema minus]